MPPADRRTFIKTAAGALVAVPLIPELGWARPYRAPARISVGVIGVGRQGRAILGELQKIEGVTVAAICDTDASRLSAGQRRTAGGETFAEYKQLLEKKKDAAAIFIATPTHLHRQIALDCIQAGRHVFCEGPLASTVDDCKAIAAAARGASTVFQTGLYARSNPVYQLARSFYKTDAVRTLVSMRAEDNRKNSWRTPTSSDEQDRALNWHLNPEISLGLPGEMGTHQFDVFHFFLGRYPTAVRGSGAIRVHNDGRKIADTIQIDLAFDGAVGVGGPGSGGAHLQYAATLCSSFEGRHEVFHGEAASIKLAWTHGWMFKEADAPTQGWEVWANRQQFHNDEGITLIADATKLHAQGKLKEGVGLPNSPMSYAIEDFFKSVLEKKAVVCTADEGVRASAVGIAASRAVTTGETVALDPELFKA